MMASFIPSDLVKVYHEEVSSGSLWGKCVSRWPFYLKGNIPSASLSMDWIAKGCGKISMISDSVQQASTQCSKTETGPSTTHNLAELDSGRFKEREDYVFGQGEWKRSLRWLGGKQGEIMELVEPSHDKSDEEPPPQRKWTDHGEYSRPFGEFVKRLPLYQTGQV